MYDISFPVIVPPLTKMQGRAAHVHIEGFGRRSSKRKTPVNGLGKGRESAGYLQASRYLRKGRIACKPPIATSCSSAENFSNEAFSNGGAHVSTKSKGLEDGKTLSDAPVAETIAPCSDKEGVVSGALARAFSGVAANNRTRVLSTECCILIQTAGMLFSKPSILLRPC